MKIRSKVCATEGCNGIAENGNQMCKDCQRKLARMGRAFANKVGMGGNSGKVRVNNMSR